MKKIFIFGFFLMGCSTWVNTDKTRVWEIDHAECRAKATEGKIVIGYSKTVDIVTRGCLYKKGWEKK